MRKPRVLVGCERSGIVREAYRRAGYEAYSCDLEPAEDGSPYHFQCDIVALIELAGRGYFDLIILHPECTAVTVAGNHVYAKGKAKYGERLASVRWTEELWALAVEYCGAGVALENPLGVLSTQSNLGRAAQYVQPYDFGDDASKSTGLWLHNLPPLIKDPGKRVPGRVVVWKGKERERWSNQTDSGQNRLGPSPTRAIDRARTYPGIAGAMVTVWGEYITRRAA